MRKLDLRVEDLSVESFATGRGGVQGYTGALCVDGDASWDGTCGGFDTNYTCQATCRCSQVVTRCDDNTCAQTCGVHNTCAGSCGYTCYPGDSCTGVGACCTGLC